MATNLNTNFFLTRLVFIYSTTLLYTPSHPTKSHLPLPTPNPDPLCNPEAHIRRDLPISQKRLEWNCLRNQRAEMGRINSWIWKPRDCILNRVDPFQHTIQ
ncbi:hypothetical protein ACH5RR_022334 [Cinchona calisaya]|uniref:Trichome birefringence-like N-terminal domain-containing protein n=1 Tax=Cinchona calisaya TaxID=153742 RepID=A0ABD2ZBF0_9GENT